MSTQGINVLEFTNDFEFWLRAIDDTVWGGSGFIAIINQQTKKQYYVAPNEKNPVLIHSATEATVFAKVLFNHVLCDLEVDIEVKPDGNYISYEIQNGDHIVERYAKTKCNSGGYMRIIGLPDKQHPVV